MKKTTIFQAFSSVDAANSRRYVSCITPPVASVSGREAGSLESASAFISHEAKETPRMVCHGDASNEEEEESAERPFGPQSGQESPTLGANPTIPKKRHPAFAGRRAGDAITGGVKKLKGVFGAGALMPQFLAELTITLNSHIWDYHTVSARSWQVSGFSAVQIPQPPAREFGLAFRHEFPRDSGLS